MADAAKAPRTATSAIRTSKAEYDLVLVPAPGGAPSRLRESVRREIVASGRTFCIFGCELQSDSVTFKFDGARARSDLVDLLIESKTILHGQIAKKEGESGTRFLITGLPGELGRRDGDSISRQIVKYINDTAELHPEGSGFVPADLRMVDVDDGMAVAITTCRPLIDFLLDNPNIFVQLDHLTAYYYPPAPFCTNCCSLEHQEADCIGEPVCSQCGGAHAAGGCRPQKLSCFNCKSDQRFRKRTRHSARSSLCKARVAAFLDSIGIELNA